MQDLTPVSFPIILQLTVRHRTVTGGEINVALENAPNAGPGADRLIVNFDVRLTLVEFDDPAGINRVSESRPSPRENGSAEG